MRSDRKPATVDAALSPPWQALLRGLALSAPRLTPSVNSWMFRALAQRLPLASRHPTV